MPEAVIVSTARSPIGRAFKGSLTEMRADDLTVQMVKAALAKVPELDPKDITDLMLGCGLPGGEQGFNMGRVVAVLLGFDHLPGTTITRYCSSSLADHPHGVPRHQGRRGRRVHLGRRRDRQPLRQGQQRPHRGPGPQEPGVRRRRAAHREARAGRRRSGTTRARTTRSPTSTSRWARRPRTCSSSSACRARSRTSSASAARTSPRRRIADGFWAKDITPVTLPDGSTVVDRRRPARRRDARGRVRSCKPVFRPDGTVTAGNCCAAQRRRRRRGRHERHQGEGARPHAARAHRLHRRHRPVAGDHGPRPGRGHPAGAAPRGHDASTTSTCSRSTRRSPCRRSARRRSSASRSTS